MRRLAAAARRAVLPRLEALEWIIGLGLITIGVSMIYVPAGFIVAGVSVCALAFAEGRA